MKPERLLVINGIIASVSFAILWFYDWPIEALGATGFAWVMISIISTLKALRRP